MPVIYWILPIKVNGDKLIDLKRTFSCPSLLFVLLTELSLCLYVTGRKGPHLYLSCSAVQTHTYTERAQPRPRCSLKQIGQGRMEVIFFFFFYMVRKHTLGLNTQTKNTHLVLTTVQLNLKRNFVYFHTGVPEGIHKQRVVILPCKHPYKAGLSTASQQFLDQAEGDFVIFFTGTLKFYFVAQ